MVKVNIYNTYAPNSEVNILPKWAKNVNRQLKNKATCPVDMGKSLNLNKRGNEVQKSSWNNIGKKIFISMIYVDLLGNKAK